MLDQFRRAVIVALFVCAPAWSFAQTAAAPDGLTEAERTAIRALIDKAPKDGQRRFYDLSDPSEEMALRALMRINGRTPRRGQCWRCDDVSARIAPRSSASPLSRPIAE